MSIVKRPKYEIDVVLSDQFIMQGIKHKYPQCCIDAFVEDCWNGVNPADVRPAVNGFVPCKNCLISKDTVKWRLESHDKHEDWPCLEQVLKELNL